MLHRYKVRFTIGNDKSIRVAEVSSAVYYEKIENKLSGKEEFLYEFQRHLRDYNQPDIEESRIVYVKYKGFG